MPHATVSTKALFFITPMERAPFLFPPGVWIMSKKQLTEEQKQRRAETARRNDGAKSRGPVTPEGKYRSSMNAIVTGEHVELHKENLPPFYFLLSTDDRADYLRSFQSMLRQFKPNSEFELSLIRRMAIALFQHDRFTTLGTEVMQREIDKVVRKYPSLGLSEQFFHGHKQAVVEKELQRFVARGQKQQLSAFQSFHKTLLLVQKHSPMQPPEPVDTSADIRQLREDDPAPEVVEELLALAERAKIEPSFPVPEYVLTMLTNKHLMDRIAPNYDPGDLLERHGLTQFPKAA
jgi:ribosomal protein L17